MYGIFGEDPSDYKTLREIVRKLTGDPSLRVEGKGFGGCDKLLDACAERLKFLHGIGFRRFIICHDADGRKPDDVKAEVVERVIKTSGVETGCFVAVPVQEIEAWILADIESATKLFTSWRPREVKSPESIPDPKELLEKMSRQENSRPRYFHVRDNPRIVAHLDWDRVAAKCRSFRELREFVLGR